MRKRSGPSSSTPLASILFSLVLLWPVPCLAAETPGGSVAAQFQKAEQLENTSQSAEAVKVYQQIITASPGSEDAFKAYRQLTCTLVSMNDLAQARSTVEKMLSEFARHARLPHAVHEVVETCARASKAGTIGQVYQEVLASGQAGSQAIWLQMGMALAQVYLKDQKAAEAAVQRLVTEYAADSRVAEAVNQVAWGYRRLKEEDKARILYRYVATQWPNKDRAVIALRGVALCSLALNDQAGAEAALALVNRKRIGAVGVFDKVVRPVAIGVGQVSRDVRVDRARAEMC